jgi:hypothetical protein
VTNALHVNGNYGSRNTFSNCWLNGLIFLEDVDVRNNNRFLGCLFKHNDIAWDGAAPVQNAIIVLHSSGIGKTLLPMQITGCIFDGLSAGAGRNSSLEVTDGTFTAATRTAFFNNMYLNSCTSLRHATSGALTVFAEGDIDEDAGKIGIGRTVGSATYDGNLVLNESTGNFLIDVLGASGDARAGVRLWDSAAATPSYLGMFYRSTNKIRFERRDDSTYTTIMELSETVSSSGETGMWLIVNDGGGTSLKRVYVGADDSGGAGYQLLRVPN